MKVKHYLQIGIFLLISVFLLAQCEKDKSNEPTGQYSIKPASSNFGEIAVNAEKSQEFVIQNGEDTLKIESITIEGDNKDEFSTNGNAVEIQPNQTHIFNVTFKPTSEGDKTATLIITDSKGLKKVVLNGKARETTSEDNNYTITPDKVEFAETTVNNESTKEFTIKNNGSKVLNITSFVIEGNNKSEFSTDDNAVEIQPNETYKFNVTFKPTSKGDKVATLKVSDDKGSKTVALSGKAKEASSGGGTQDDMGNDVKIRFLHHSTGQHVYNDGGVSELFNDYNKANGKNYSISEQLFPSDNYENGWSNYPYDYWNIWVKNAGNTPFGKGKQPTLEILTKEYNVVIWKHCFPVSNIYEAIEGEPNIESKRHSLGNFKLQYEALKKKMKEFPNTRFIVWTGAVRSKTDSDGITEEQAKRAKQFFNWVKNTWDEKGDNIYVFDFYQLETEGGLYLKQEYASKGGTDSHPNATFSKKTAPKFVSRIVDVIQGKGDTGNLTGE